MGNKKINKKGKPKSNKNIYQLFKQQRQSSPRSGNCLSNTWSPANLYHCWEWLQVSASSRGVLGELVWETALRPLICATEALSELRWHPRDSYAPNKWILKLRHSKILKQVKNCCVKAKRALTLQGHLILCMNLPHQFLAASSLRGLNFCQLSPEDMGRDVFLAQNS